MDSLQQNVLLEFLGSLHIEALQGLKTTVVPVGNRHELVVRSNLSHSSVVDNSDSIGIADGTEPVCNDNGCDGSIFHDLVQCLLNNAFTLAIKS